MNHALQNQNATGNPASGAPTTADPTTGAPTEVAARLAARLHDGLPGHMGIELLDMQPGAMVLQMAIRPMHLAANGYLHAGAVVTLADTACGFGCIANLPADASNFTTVELKSNFLSTTLEGVIIAQATLRHAGQRTQIWDAEVRTAPQAQGKVLALFRCTQMILYP